MGKAPTIRPDSAGPARAARSASRSWVRSPPSRAFVAGLSAAGCAVIVYLGVPGAGVSPGDRAPRTFVARVRFTAVDRVETDRRKRNGRDRVLSVYSEVLGWREQVLRSVTALLEATAKSRDLDAARIRLSTEGIESDPAPVWEYVRAEGAGARDEILQTANRIVWKLEWAGVVSSERMEVERSSGRRGIRRDEREALLQLAGRKGVIDMDAAREAVVRELRAAYTDRAELVSTLAQALCADLGPSLIWDEESTATSRRAAEREVREVFVDVRPGRVIAREGEPVGQREHDLILREAREYHTSLSLVSRAMRLAGTFAVIAVMVAGLGAAMARLEPRALRSPRAVFFAGALDLVVVGAARGLVVGGGGLPAIVAPAALAAMLFALTVSPLFAVLNSVVLAAVVALQVGGDYAVPFALAAGAIAAAHAAARARRRSELLRAGAIAGIVQFLVVVGVKLGAGVEEAPVLLMWGGWALSGGFAWGLLSLGALPAAEAAFGVTTDISLLELSDQNHPALRRLLLEAPGTYHHSLIVGNLSETAALAVGANALLARVASYYHDLGKVDRPEYFVENEPAGRSRHDGLSPTMSTLIITSHVRDGVALGGQYGLPQAILGIMREHHGTSLVEFFYRAAVERMSEETGEGESVDEQPFRYAGPKPQTREAGIVLLADTVEAASRALTEPTSPRLSKLVHDLTMRRLLDGQFDESGLTLRDLRTMSDAFVRVLMSMFHARVKYPAAPPSARGQALSGSPAPSGTGWGATR